MEVIWIRQFTFYLGSVVYAFAAILALYLGATTSGRTPIGMGSDPRSEREPHRYGSSWDWLRCCRCCLPIRVFRCRSWKDFGPSFLGRAPRRSGHHALQRVSGVRDADAGGPRLGKATRIPPAEICRERTGIDTRARCWPGSASCPGRASVGACARSPRCCLRRALASAVRAPRGSRTILKLAPSCFTAVAVLLCLPLVASPAATGRIPRAHGTAGLHGHRDCRGRGHGQALLTNGTGMTRLTTITKMMAHMPLSFLQRPASNGLVICFGMGTTFRSMLSWGIHVTAVELVPSVPKVFGYFHPDGPALLRSAAGAGGDRRRAPFPGALHREVRRDHGRSTPAGTRAGSSLLYSREFYAIVKRHLRPGGIVQVWLPGGDDQTRQPSPGRFSSVPACPRVRVHRGMGNPFPGEHGPAPRGYGRAVAAAIAARRRARPGRMGTRLEPGQTAGEGPVARGAVEDFLKPAPHVPAIQDDRPINEYFLLRQIWPSLGR